jgi:hypothetical protein
MDIFKFYNRRELFFVQLGKKAGGQKDRNPNFNLEGVSNESE